MIELSTIQKIVIWAIPVIFAITVHEVCHGWVASKLGDPTARVMGRLTLNPIKHIDLFGTIIVPLMLLMVSNFVFGWAKPVPVDPRNFKKPTRDMAIVAAAGPLSNFLMALIWAGIAKLSFILLANHQSWWGKPLLLMSGAGIMINVVLAVLNLLPFPPLDGSKVLYNFLPKRLAYSLQRSEGWGFMVLMLLWFTNALSSILGPPIFFILGWITHVFGLTMAM